MPLEIRRNEKGGTEPCPFATRTLFRWTVNDPLGVKGKTLASVNLISTSLEKQVEEFWKIEGAQIASGSKGPSVEAGRALRIMEETMKLDEGHYGVGIPFCEGKQLLNNRALAVKRLRSLTKKLEKNSTLREEYNAGIAKLIGGMWSRSRKLCLQKKRRSGTSHTMQW